MAWLSTFRFNLAFENSSSKGYITEKITEPLLAGCVPVYWGAPDVGVEFDSRCFLKVPILGDSADTIEWLLELDRSPDRIEAMQSAPVFQGDRLPVYFNQGYIGEPIRRLLESGEPPGRRTYRRRRLRAHTYRSVVDQTWSSLACRAEALAWKLGIGRAGGTWAP